jgi:ankyrin repeat protein
MNGHLEIVQMLIEATAPVKYPDLQQESPLLLAAIGGHFEVIKRLRTAGAKIRPTSTASQAILACSTGFMGADILKVLLEEGLSPDSTGDQGETCLHRAAASGLISVMRHLIDAGGRVDAQDSIGRTPLMRACAGKHLEAVSVLIAAKSDLTITDQEGHSALSWASNQNHEILDRLLDHGAPVNYVDVAGRTPLFEACLAGDCSTVQTLLDHGAKIDARTNAILFHEKTSVTLPRGCTPLMAAALIDHPILINTLTDANLEDLDLNQRRTSLLLAAEHGNYEAFLALLNRGSRLTARSSLGRSVLELAVMGGNVKILDHLMSLHKNELKTKKQPLFSSEEFTRATYSVPRVHRIPGDMVARLKKLSLPGNKFYEGVELADPQERLFS